VGDLDNDGRLDLVIVSQNEPLAFFRNRTSRGPFVTLLLEATASPRAPASPRVTIPCGGRRQVAQRLGGGSYQSASDPRLHFGLRTAATIDWGEGRGAPGPVGPDRA